MQDKIYFMAGLIPASQVKQMINLFAWCDENNFKIFKCIPVIGMESSSPIAVPGKTQGAMSTFIFVYCSGDPSGFRQYFGREYSEKILPEVPGIIAEAINIESPNIEGG